MRKKLLSIGLFLFLFLLNFQTVYALPSRPPKSTTSDSTTQIGCGGFGSFSDKLCNSGIKNPDVLGSIFNAGLSAILGLLTIIGGLYFFIQFVTAGLAWIGSGGDKNNIEAARNKIMNAILGLAIVVMAWVFIGIIGRFVGLDILNPGAAIEKIQLGK